ncbi:MAG: discoidin domain-containing protein [Chloroflexota bacterium]
MKIRLVSVLACILFSALGSGCSIAASENSTPFPLPSTPVVQELQYLPASALSDLQPVTVTASSSLPDAPAVNAVDGSPDTVWNSGADPDQWIQLDLGTPTTIQAIRLLVSQYPAGDTVHQIWAGADPDNLTLLHEFRGFTNDGDLLEFIPIIPPTNIQFIKIITTQSTSWVAWREIEVEGE